jgi:hypothetical protein
MLDSSHPETMMRTIKVSDSQNEIFSARSRKSRGCAEANIRSPHKQARRLTQKLRKIAVSGQNLVSRLELTDKAGSWLALPWFIVGGI